MKEMEINSYHRSVVNRYYRESRRLNAVWKSKDSRDASTK